MLLDFKGFLGTEAYEVDDSIKFKSTDDGSNIILYFSK